MEWERDRFRRIGKQRERRREEGMEKGQASGEFDN